MFTVTVYVDGKIHKFQVEAGSNLRNALLKHDLSPYTYITRRFNCGGRGLCATCGVWIDNTIDASHWHDKAADIFGYPRLSCQITVQHDIMVRLVQDKRIWGQRDPNKATLFAADE